MYIFVVGNESNDSIRIQIKNASDGSVVYDTQPGASDTTSPALPVSAGNIIAH